jgi:hypothetical protein
MLASWSFHRWKWRGLLVPSMLISYSEIQFMSLTFLYYGVITKWFLFPVFIAALVLYGIVFRRFPGFVLLAGIGILVLDLLDGFRLSWGFVVGDPYLYDPYTNAKEVFGWCLTSLGAYLDTRTVFSLYRIRRSGLPFQADGLLT